MKVTQLLWIGILMLVPRIAFPQPADDEQDPFLGQYVLGNDAEIMLGRMNRIGLFDYLGDTLAPLANFGTGGERFCDAMCTDLDV